MGTYVPPADVLRLGRPINLGRSLSELESQLRDGEKAATVTNRGLRQVSLVISRQSDYDAVTRDRANLEGVYAIGSAVLRASH